MIFNMMERFSTKDEKVKEMLKEYDDVNESAVEELINEVLRK